MGGDNAKKEAPPPPPPSGNDAAVANTMNAAGAETKKAKGRAATQLTGSTGLTGAAPTSQKSLLGI